ncbi:hypothetical protein Zmor_027296 [Zophobas morio]|uniref:Uncharacterized protein n=1 Tax=Zophobas morio TaxID=2755281 RepID=A0AA38HNR5_9CUCU|nr:hypothetical protein Zmor_027296 [Zophobas morio]
MQTQQQYQCSLPNTLYHVHKLTLARLCQTISQFQPQEITINGGQRSLLNCGHLTLTHPVMRVKSYSPFASRNLWSYPIVSYIWIIKYINVWDEDT